MQFHVIAGGPKLIALFSDASETDGFVTGQMPDTPALPGALPEGIVAQTDAVMANLLAVLSRLEPDVRTRRSARVHLIRVEDDYAAMNMAYESYFAKDQLPDRTCVGVAGLAYDAVIGNDLIARRSVEL